MIISNNIKEPKDISQWTTEENWRTHNDISARNIISSVLTLNEFYKITVYKGAKKMLYVLQSYP